MASAPPSVFSCACAADMAIVPPMRSATSVQPCFMVFSPCLISRLCECCRAYTTYDARSAQLSRHPTRGAEPEQLADRQFTRPFHVAPQAPLLGGHLAKGILHAQRDGVCSTLHLY